MNCKRKSRRRFFLLVRSRTPPISSEFRGGGGLNTPNPPSRYATDAYRGYESEGLPSVPSNKLQRNSEVQVDRLRGASEVGTGLSVTRHDKAKNVHSCFPPADVSFVYWFTFSPFVVLGDWCSTFSFRVDPHGFWYRQTSLVLNL